MARSVERETRILDAAHALLLKQGWRGTSMEAIAARAAIAKPTLYAYFPDKVAILAAITGRLRAEWRADFTAAIAGAEPLTERIAAALAGWQKAIARLRGASPHADDLLGDGSVPAAEMIAAIESALVAAGMAQPRLLAQILVAASEGIGGAARSPAEIGPGVRLLTERMLRGEDRRGG